MASEPAATSTISRVTARLEALIIGRLSEGDQCRLFVVMADGWVDVGLGEWAIGAHLASDPLIGDVQSGCDTAQARAILGRWRMMAALAERPAVDVEVS